MTRRQTLVAIAQIAAVSSLASCGMDSNDASLSPIVSVQQASDSEILASVAYDLFPHPILPAEIYVKAANTILSLNDPLVNDGLLQLRDLSNNQSWLNVPDAQRMTILTSLQDSEFFALVRATTVSALYSEPALFDLVGYGGSAIELGGYINRGFDDISWLPEQAEAQ